VDTVDKPQDRSPSEWTRLRQQVAEAEERLGLARRREEAMVRLRGELLSAPDPVAFFPRLEKRLVEELRGLDVPVHKLSMQLPADQTGFFVEYSAAVRHLAPASVRHPLADSPWVREAWSSGKPVLVSREQCEAGRFPAEVRCHLEVPLPGGGSLGVGSAEEDAFGDEEVWTVQTAAALMVEGLQRLKDFGEKIQSKDRLDQVLETAHMSGWEWDLRKREIAWCENLEPLLGLHPGSFDGTSLFFFECVHPEDRDLLAESLNPTLENGANHETEFRLLWPDQTTRWMRSQGRIFFDETGFPVQMVGVIMDITLQRQLGDEMRQLQKMEIVGTLAGGVAHDFNNLLMGIMGSSYYLLEGLDVEDPLHQEVDQILQQVDRAANLTRQLLAFSRRQIVQPQVLDLAIVISGMDKMLRHLIGKDTEIVTVFGRGGRCVRADPGQIEQIIVNLAVNAHEAMAGGGKLTIETANVEMDRAYVRQHPRVVPGPYVKLTVSDTGHGMDEETLSHIFEPFFTTKEPDKGTGLGLSTVYGIVEQNGGRIEVSSTPGQGTAFSVYLPQVGETAEETFEEQAAPDFKQGTETILLVEDEEVVRKLLQKMLSHQGYNLLETCDGEDALRIFTQNRDSIHLVVTDVVMPNMSGTELVRNLRALRPETKVLYVSGHPERTTELESELGPKVGLLYKPFKREALLTKVRNLLDES
jgi:two-component system, cell cycle sensor histidine kinase and response regulator CckA